MSEQFVSSKLRFYLTETQPCPYIEGRIERKLFAPLVGPFAGAVNDTLSANGFRRSQNVAYRPQCPGCNACVATRIAVAQHEPSRRDRRILKRNALLERAIKPALATDIHYALFRKYVCGRHADGGMAEMDALDFASMTEDSTVRTQIIEYWGRDEEGSEHLRAACISDVMADGLSMVYSFFDPDFSSDSLGRFMVLDHVRLVKALGLPHLYLGYWIAESRKMSYKVDFSGVEVLRGGEWSDTPPPKSSTPTRA